MQNQANIQHKGLYDSWKTYSLAFQMANIGSEISRSLKNQTNPMRFQSSFDRALELFDFTIQSEVEKQHVGSLREVCRAREEFCDFFNGNSYHTKPEIMQRYYDQFACLERQ